MKLLYISRINFFSDRAHVYTVTKTCEAFSQIPETTIMLVSTDNSLNKDGARETFFKTHAVTHPFEIVSLSSWANAVKDTRYSFLTHFAILLANFSLLRFVWNKRKEFDVLYFRDHQLLLPIFFTKFILRKPLFYENHYILTKKFSQWVTEQCIKISRGVIVIAGALKAYYEKINPRIIISYCAAAEPERFEKITDSQQELRNKLNLPQNATILGYGGNLNKTGNGDSYGIEDIIKALPLLPDNVIFMGLGKKTSTPLDIEILAETLGVKNKLLLLPWVERNNVAPYVLASDILLIPASGAQPGNSPTKMFEYLVSGKPVVAARTEPIEEVLKDGFNALLVDYREPQAWRQAIDKLINNQGLKDILVANAYADSKNYSWHTRAETIVNFIRQTV